MEVKGEGITFKQGLIEVKKVKVAGRGDRGSQMEN